MTAPSIPSPGRFSGLSGPHGAASTHLDALRGIAAIGVCSSHLRDLFLTDYPSLPHHNPLLFVLYLATGVGHQWVMVFFVLSGYLVGGSVLRAFARDCWSWREYLLKRMTRLYAVLIPALLLGGALDAAGIHFFGTAGIYGGKAGSHVLMFDVGSQLHLGILLGNYAFLQGIWVPTFGSNGPLWSLANEFWYYLAFPLIYTAAASRSGALRRLFSLMIFIAILIFVGREIALYFLVWVMGVGIHFLPPLRVRSILWRRTLIAIAACGMAATLAWSKQDRSGYSDWVLSIVVSALVYVFVCCSDARVRRPYEWTSHALSRSSYTLYLVHLPLLAFLASWIGRIRQPPSPSQLALVCAVFLITMAYAQLVWFLFEKRTDALRKWLKPIVLGTEDRSRAKSLQNSA